MTDHANELRRYSRKIGHPAGDVPSVMLAAADEIERLAARLEAAEKERDELRVELETERVRLAACGVVALANTPDSAKKARDMRPEYWSASCGDVARMVDENISLRARIEQMEKQVPICRAEDLRHAEILLPSLGLMPEDKLYALPGAKGEKDV